MAAAPLKCLQPGMDPLEFCCEVIDSGFSCRHRLPCLAAQRLIEQAIKIGLKFQLHGQMISLFDSGARFGSLPVIAGADITRPLSWVKQSPHVGFLA